MMVNRKNYKDFLNFYIFPDYLFKEMKEKNFADIFGSWGYKILKEDPYSMIKTLSKEKLKNNFFYLSGKEDFRKIILCYNNDIVYEMKKHKN